MLFLLDKNLIPSFNLITLVEATADYFLKQRLKTHKVKSVQTEHTQISATRGVLVPILSFYLGLESAGY